MAEGGNHKRGNCFTLKYAGIWKNKDRYTQTNHGAQKTALTAVTASPLGAAIIVQCSAHHDRRQTKASPLITQQLLLTLHN